MDTSVASRNIAAYSIIKTSYIRGMYPRHGFQAFKPRTGAYPIFAVCS